MAEVKLDWDKLTEIAKPFVSFNVFADEYNNYVFLEIFRRVIKADDRFYQALFDEQLAKKLVEAFRSYVRSWDKSAVKNYDIKRDLKTYLSAETMNCHRKLDNGKKLLEEWYRVKINGQWVSRLMDADGLSRLYDEDETAIIFLDFWWQQLVHHFDDNRMFANQAELLHLLEVQSRDERDVSKVLFPVNDDLKMLAKHLSQDEDAKALALTVKQLLTVIGKLVLGKRLTYEEYTWLTKTTDALAIMSLMQRMDLEDRIKPAKLPKKLEGQLFKDLDQKEYYLKRVYAIDDQSTTDGFKYHRTLLHGTINASVLSIIKLGLQNNKQLNQMKVKHDYTGSGLGTGIYFARMDQAGKPINYSSGGDYQYLFVAEVGYNKLVDLQEYNELQETKPGEMLWAHGVGSGDRDELLVPDNRQVKLKYLLEFKALAPDF